MEHEQGQTNLITSSDAVPSVSKLSRIQQAILNLVLASDVYLTKKEISEKLQISYSCVFSAMSDPKYLKAYQFFCVQASAEKFKDVMSSLADLAAAGSHQHQKIYLTIHGLLGEKNKESNLPSPDDDMEKLRRRQKAIEEELRGAAKDATFSEEPK